MCAGMNERDDWRGGFLTRLARDVRANTLIIVAFALIPLCGMIGGGLDLSRMYIVKTRLQHACDAGALAGRKSMGGGTWAQQSGMPGKQALRFFDSNITTDAFGSENIQRSFAERAGKVTGTASANVPMTLMRVLGQTTQSLTVTCEAEMRLPNTDVMFVLDVTGSMNCVAGNKSCSNNGNRPANGSKIDGLKVAVKCFYEIVARLDTDADCEGGSPSGGTGNQVQIRFGFVPYASNVNVGRLLPTAFMVDSANYNTRQKVYSGWSNATLAGYVNLNSNRNCTGVGPENTEVRQYTVVAANLGQLGSVCLVYSQTRQISWKYGSLPLDVSGLKNGTSGWRNSFVQPIGNNFTDLTVNWAGCIEERQTVQTDNYSTIPSGAKDLDIDSAPNVNDDTTRWRPSLPEATFMRATTGRLDQLNRAEVASTSDNYERYVANDWNYYCPTPARRMQKWPTADEFDNYVDSLQAQGNTYHDIGMIWGARLISPTGIFRADNEFTPEGGEIERHLIFMTDGDATSAPCDYNAYGIPFFDRRQTNSVGSASTCTSQSTTLANQINARLTALCAAVKNRNITLWVISFGGDTVQSTEDRLEACATEGRYFKADDSAELQRTFRSIADQISALRLVK